jgi:competence protein ComEA
VVLSAVVAVLLAVRTVDAVPVEQVPDRVTQPAATPAGPAATTTSSDVVPLVVASDSAAAAGAGAAAVEVVVHVVGQVAAPGLVRVAAGSRVADALDAAGGATAEADLSTVNLARELVDGEQVVVLRPGEALPPAAGAAGVGAPGAAGGPAVAARPLDLNTADAAALDALPGIGEVLAGRILAWRNERGPFTRVDELGEVSGIGDALMAELAPLVTV